MSHPPPAATLPVPRVARPHTDALGVVLSLLARLEDEHVEYCHWKSNQHVAAGLAGDTDLDLLVDGRSTTAFVRALLDAGFKRFVAHPDRSYPGVEDYLGFDPATGRLVHLHVHFQLTLGEPHLKGYRLPWEREVLASRRPDESGTIAVADPHLELLLLVVRAALKLRLRDVLRRRPRAAAAGGGMATEFRWLAERVDADRLFEVARPLVGRRAARALVTMSAAADAPDSRALLAFRRRVAPSLRSYRTFGPVEARRRRWVRELRLRWSGVRARMVGPATPSRRTLPTGGRIVALVGADGSGKSTVARDLTAWLSWKVDVVPVYFGSGAGPKSLPRRVLDVVHRTARWWRAPSGARSGAAAGAAAWSRGRPATGGLRAQLRDVLDAWWALTLAHEKHDRLTRARRARDQGAIVICDRFPQSQVPGVNDGPLLTDWARHADRLRRAAAVREMAVYDLLRRCPPDLVVKLHTSPDVAARRKPETGLAMLERKSQVVRDLRFPAMVRVAEVDADAPYEHVLLEVKRQVWEQL